jgi:hypothetical protein
MIAHDVEDFISRRLSPLKERDHPSWAHAYGKDTMKEYTGNLLAFPTVVLTVVPQLSLSFSYFLDLLTGHLMEHRMREESMAMSF